jgi:hypothetical protein
MKCSDRNQLENMASFIDFVALLIELHIWRNDIKYSSFQDASIDIKISPFEWSLELHIKCAFSFASVSRVREPNSRRADDEFGEGILGNQKLKKLYYLDVNESGFESR